MLNRVMPKDNIGLAALLRTKEAAWDNGEYIDIFKLQYLNETIVEINISSR